MLHSVRFRREAQAGFTLIEIMIAVAIIAILAAIAVPSYREYVMRGQIVDGINGLATMQASMERHFQDNRTYATANGFDTPCAVTPVSRRVVGTFTLSCTATPTNAGYTLQAVGSGVTNGFTYTVNQANTRATTSVSASSGWSTCASAWVTKKGQACP